MGASLPSGNTFHCPLYAQEHSRRASLEDKASGSLLVNALAVEFEPVSTRFFKQCSARMVHWETMGVLVSNSGLLLGLRCDARDPRLYPEGLCFGSVPAGPVGLGPAMVVRLGQRS